MAKKPEPPPQPTRWTVYKIAAKQIRLGTVETADEREAIQKVARGVQATGNEALCGAAILKGSGRREGAPDPFADITANSRLQNRFRFFKWVRISCLIVAMECR
jgi:hypothetical protein